MSECEIEKDQEYAGRYKCVTHGVWYCDALKKHKELCPVGEAECELKAERDHLRWRFWELQKRWNDAADVVRKHCKVDLGKCYIQHGIPSLVQVLKEAEAERDALKVQVGKLDDQVGAYLEVTRQKMAKKDLRRQLEKKYGV
jgi:hypothetical protein